MVIVVAKALEVVIEDPTKEFANLYRFARYLDKQPIIVSIPVVPGFRKAVVVASALQFAIKLRVEQPDAELMNELDETLEFYLHDRTVRQPIEFFHSSINALYHGTRTTLWEINNRQAAAGSLPVECKTCEFQFHCKGFFKSPSPDYSCAGIKRILGKLTMAAAELKSMSARTRD